MGSADLKIIVIEARWPESVHDQTILDASLLKVCNIYALYYSCVVVYIYQHILLQTIFNHFLHQQNRLENNEFHGSLLLGDSGYALKKYLITPLSQPSTIPERRFQKAHLKTRNSIERIFGVWKRRFPALSLGFRLKMNTILNGIVAAAVLHNIAIDLKESVDDFDEIEDLGDFNTHYDISSATSNQSVRNILINDFFSN